jgi:hypothetical protein
MKEKELREMQREIDQEEMLKQEEFEQFQERSSIENQKEKLIDIPERSTL